MGRDLVTTEVFEEEGESLEQLLLKILLGSDYPEAVGD
ncbi:hypothetical protein GGQ84_002147 [Desulfitispora alkaliphila]